MLTKLKLKSGKGNYHQRILGIVMEQIDRFKRRCFVY